VNLYCTKLGKYVCFGQNALCQGCFMWVN